MTAGATWMPSMRLSANREELGRAAAADIADDLRRRLARQDSVRLVFAAAPSQQSMLEHLRVAEGVDWSRVTAFHLDEYLGLPAETPARFGNWLARTFFDHVPLAAAHLIETTGDPATCAEQYGKLLAGTRIDLVCLGIGVNGHLGFNEPPDADLADPLPVRPVRLDHATRKQQVDEGCFATLAEVPTAAITLTVPRLLKTDRLFCVVPGRAKRTAVRRALRDPIGPECPATALRTHQNVALYLDEESAPYDD